MKEWLTRIVEDPSLHARWLNTLSMLENEGARKIKRCEDPVFVSEEILKHAAEEARHAWYLKKQIRKIKPLACPTYERQYLIAPIESYQYLNSIDITVCRYLRNSFGLKGGKLKYLAYLLVTYAIEVRADALYPVYQEILRECQSAVSVYNIIAEEKNHLAEMEKQLQAVSADWAEMCAVAVAAETSLHYRWLKAIGHSAELIA